MERWDQDDRRLYDRVTVAKMLGRNVRTLENWINRGEFPLPTHRIAGRPFWRAEVVDAFIVGRKP